jgi:16S rRNA (guanine1207-N2)-methyltransferase
MEIPKGRGLIRRWLVEAHAALRPGGKLYLAGPNDLGVQPAIADAEALFGLAMQLGYKQRNRVGCAVKQPDPPTIPPWLAEPGIAPGTWYEFTIEARGELLKIRSLPGIFAYDRLDAGTALLLKNMQVPRSGRVLDIGCGYGAIGLVAARLGAAQVDMLDADLLAVAASRENIALNQAANARVLPSDVLDAVAGERYDLIVSNPPFHAGRLVEYDVAHAIVAQAAGALAPGGRLLVVANSFLRYDQVMRQHFATVERVAATGQYHILAASVS